MTSVIPEAPPARRARPLATEQEAREVAEAAREKEWEKPSFVRQLFEGKLRLDLIHPYPGAVGSGSRQGAARSWSGSSASCASRWTATGSTGKARSRRR